jgi:deoxyribodipyrimidine photo-lyase
MTAVVVFTRDLRIRDNPALAAACASGPVVPMFVLDDALQAGHAASPNRTAFLGDALVDLDDSLRRLGASLLVRRGRFVDEVLKVAHDSGAQTIHVADDVSTFAHTRLDRLERYAGAAGVGMHRHGGVTVVAPGALSPAGGGEFKVFTPYHRRWVGAQWRHLAPTPTRIDPAPRLSGLSAREAVSGAARAAGAAPDLARGGETAGLERLKTWAAAHLHEYEARHDDLAGAATSQISPYLHFGCLSPLEVATRLRERQGGAAFVRQLCWRDFYHQVLAARPDASINDYRARGHRWVDDDELLAAWQLGRTGYPVVDAAMRQLLTEGFMHNRARMVVASLLTKDLCMDWRAGADHFMAHLVDADVANNQLNWQWTAGTGTDTNPHRIFNPTTQGYRFDPTGDYVRRYVPELAGVAGKAVHDPAPDVRQACGYVAPIVDHHEAIAAYRAMRAVQ